MSRYPRIEQYGLIGDMQTAALVCDDGGIDWLCLPRFDSPAVFTSLLGTERHGSWRVGPDPTIGGGVTTKRGYRGDSLVLESEWYTPAGTVRVTDFMPPRGRASAPQVIRIVDGLSGDVPMVSTVRPRMEYGRVSPWIHQEGGRMVAEAGPEALWLDAPTQHIVTDGAMVSAFNVTAGDSVAFVLSRTQSHAAPPETSDPETALTTTLSFWREWTAQGSYEVGRYHDAVVRSVLTSKALTYGPSGGIVAAPTTSLPEEPGGARNWDYRYTWLRDSSTTLAALLGTGHLQEAQAWTRWLLRAVAGDPENLQIMYGITGERDLPERELPWLPGYEDSSPVRVGNGATDQLQLDVYGEVIETLYLSGQSGFAPCRYTSILHRRLVEQLAERWQEPDEGIWEIRGPRRHFVHSKVMAWVAVDRTVRLAEAGALDVDLCALKKLREAIHHEVCTRGFDPARNTFTQSYGSPELDASLLVIPRVGFLPPKDPRVMGTVDAIRRELATPDGFVRRYLTAGDSTGVDGLAGDEGTFLLCSFWLVDALALIGRLDEAHALFDRLLTVRNNLGLLAEEYDPLAGRQLGNFPQAFSHMGLIRSALLLHQLASSSAQEPKCHLPCPSSASDVQSANELVLSAEAPAADATILTRA
ncbi:glycoside hydrolase family 15 protein [Streptomyces lydicus]|uniref:glycoside hydrolase family 15 protein n=1 Tax=Streptomyces lydicus TaxID=47763 RepID=UPI0033F2CC37